MPKFINSDYHDRGMKKWAGFIISEHAEVQNKYDDSKKKINIQKPQMSDEEVGKVLQQARLKNKQVTIQIEAVDSEGSYYDDVIGYVEGTDSLGLYISSQKVDYDEIRNIQLFEHKKWSDLS